MSINKITNCRILARLIDILTILKGVFPFKTSIVSSQNVDDLNSIKRKIEMVTKHLNPHAGRVLNAVLQDNPDNARIICDYIIAQQNEINIKESTKETKIKKIAHLSSIFIIKKYSMT